MTLLAAATPLRPWQLGLMFFVALSPSLGTAVAALGRLVLMLWAFEHLSILEYSIALRYLSEWQVWVVLQVEAAEQDQTRRQNLLVIVVATNLYSLRLIWGCTALLRGQVSVSAVVLCASMSRVMLPQLFQWLVHHDWLR